MSKKVKSLINTIAMTGLMVLTLIIGIYANNNLRQAEITGTLHYGLPEARVKYNKDTFIYFDKLAEAVNYVNNEVPDAVVEILKDIEITQAIPITTGLFFSVAPGESFTISQGSATQPLFNISGNNVNFGALNQGISFVGCANSQASLFNIVSGNVTITGGTYRNNTVSSSDAGGVFTVELGSTLTIKGGQFKENTSDYYGGVVYNKGTTTIYGGVFESNTAEDEGGVVYNIGTTTIYGGFFEANAAIDGKGGVIYNEGNAAIYGGYFSENSALKGAVAFNSSSLVIFSGDFRDNQAAQHGGVAYNDSGSLSITSGTFISNTADNGGAICNSKGQVTVEGGLFKNNSADSYGDTIDNVGEESVLTIKQGQFLYDSELEKETIHNSSLAKLEIENNPIITGHVTLDADTYIDFIGEIWIKNLNVYLKSAANGVKIAEDKTTSNINLGSKVKIYRVAHSNYFFDTEQIGKVLYTKIHAATPGLSYTLINNNTEYRVSIGTATSKDIVIPNYYANKPVTEIAASGFRNNQLASVEIPDGVTSIGDFAFENNKLTSITIPNSVTSIGMYAFYQNQLTSVVIPSSVTAIASSTFANNQLTSVIIPNSVTSIGAGAFYQNQLTSVVIPSGVTSIVDYTFKWNKLTSITIPNSVTSIGYGAFGENLLTSVEIPNGVTTIGDYAFENNKLTGITIPNNVTSIASYAFSGNELEEVTILGTSTLLSSTQNANEFGANPGLVITVPETAYGFYSMDSTWEQYWDNLEGVNRLFRFNSIKDENDDVVGYEVAGFADGVSDITELTGANAIPSKYMGRTVTSIGEMAFYNKGITSVAIPSSVTNIKSVAFAFNQLTNVEIPSGVTSIGASAFNNNQLTSVVIPSSTTIIGASAFRNNRLTSVEIPSSVSSIGGYAFSGNQIGFVAMFEGLTPPTTIDVSIFGYISDVSAVYVPQDSLNTYKSKQNLSIYADKIQPYTTGLSYTELTTGDYAGTYSVSYGYATNKNVFIPKMFKGKIVTTIGDMAFNNKDIKSVVIPSSVTSIGIYAFASNQLTSVTIPSSLTSIGANAFSLNQLTSVEILNGATSIYSEAFAFNYLTSVAIPSSVTSIGAGAFKYNSGLKAVTILGTNTLLSSTQNANEFGTNPGLVITVPDGAYYTYYNHPTWSQYKEKIVKPYTEGLQFTYVSDGGYYEVSGYTVSSTEVVIPLTYDNGANGLKAVKSIGSEAFKQKGITSVIIPNSVTYIGMDAFYSNQLTRVTIPSSVIEIGGYAFDNNPGVTAIFEGTTPPTTIGDEIFGDLNNVLAIYVPEDALYDYQSALGTYADIIEEFTATDGLQFTYKTEDGGYYEVSDYNGSSTKVVIPLTYDDGTHGEKAVKSIGTYAFNEKWITSVIIPNSVKVIGDYAFISNLLTSVHIPNSVTSIGVEAFDSNQNLSILTFEGGSNLTSIGDYAFWSNSLEEVVIPSSVTNIGYGAFGDNRGLTAVTVLGTNTSLSSTGNANEFGTNLGLVITVPDGAYYTYYNDPSWHQYKDNILEP